MPSLPPAMQIGTQNRDLSHVAFTKKRTRAQVFTLLMRTSAGSLHTIQSLYTLLTLGYEKIQIIQIEYNKPLLFGGI
jgi:hypothetical protein